MKKNRLIIFFLLIVAALNLFSQERKESFKGKNAIAHQFGIDQESFSIAERQDALNDSSNPFDVSGLLLDSIIYENFIEEEYVI
jgi:hypothetical protein